MNYQSLQDILMQRMQNYISKTTLMRKDEICGCDSPLFLKTINNLKEEMNRMSGNERQQYWKGLWFYAGTCGGNVSGLPDEKWLNAAACVNILQIGMLFHEMICFSDSLVSGKEMKQRLLKEINLPSEMSIEHKELYTQSMLAGFADYLLMLACKILDQLSLTENIRKCILDWCAAELILLEREFCYLSSLGKEKEVELPKLETMWESTAFFSAYSLGIKCRNLSGDNSSFGTKGNVSVVQAEREKSPGMPDAEMEKNLLALDFCMTIRFLEKYVGEDCVRQSLKTVRETMKCEENNLPGPVIKMKKLFDF